MIQTFFDKTVVVRRLRTVSGYRKSYNATATVDCAIQEMDSKMRTQSGIAEGMAWEAWFDLDAPIREGDKITDGYGTHYKVQEIIKKDYGINQHLQVMLLEYNE